MARGAALGARVAVRAPAAGEGAGGPGARAARAGRRGRTTTASPTDTPGIANGKLKLNVRPSAPGATSG